MDCLALDLKKKPLHTAMNALAVSTVLPLLPGHVLEHCWEHCGFETLTAVRSCDKSRNGAASRIVTDAICTTSIGICETCIRCKCFVLISTASSHNPMIPDLPLRAMVPTCSWCGRYISYPFLFMVDPRFLWVIYRVLERAGGRLIFGDLYPLTCVVVDLELMESEWTEDEEEREGFIWLYEQGTMELTSGHWALSATILDGILPYYFADDVNKSNGCSSVVNVRACLRWYMWWFHYVQHPHEVGACAYEMILPWQFANLADVTSSEGSSSGSEAE